MKTTRLLALGLISLSLASAFGQPSQPQPPPIAGLVSPPRAEESKLTKFNLDFPGGTPQELVNAIQKAMGKPLNAIIRDEDASVKLPPLKMSNVNVRELFLALEHSSLKRETYPSAPGQYFGAGYSIYSTTCTFKTEGPLSDDAIWFFRVDKPIRAPVAELARVCRFYSLSSYLERGLTVDDITTAIQTGWRMLGDTNTPTINYHKDTKLLIAVGEPTKLETIGSWQISGEVKSTAAVGKLSG